MLSQMARYYIRVCVCVCVYTPHFFIHLSDDGHLSCFHILAVISKAAVYIGAHISMN